MKNDTHTNLIELSELYATHKGITHWRVSYLARKDGQFFKRLRDGKSCTLKTASKVIQWFSDNWDEELDWPTHIPRPTSTKEAA